MSARISKPALAARIYVVAVAITSLAGLIYVFAFPPASMRVSAQGVPYFTPPVINPENGEPLDVDALVRHFKGE